MTKLSHSHPAVLLIGHGTRLASGVAEFHHLAQQLQRALPDRTCLAGFLELVEPSVTEALEMLRQQGFRHITALPALLMAAGHVKNDLPVLLNAFQERYPEMHVSFGADLGVHPNLLQVARERIESIEVNFGPDYQRKDTLLLVIGRGSSDPDANSNISKITRILWEGMGFGWAETAYTAVAAPLMADTLEHTHRLGFKRLVVFPYLLFTGRLVEQVCATVADYQSRHTDVQAMVAPYLNAHPLVVATFLERLAEAESGNAHMNCQFCPYRAPIVGREDWQGAPQTGHHHEHGHGHEHEHEHEHHHDHQHPNA